MKYSISDWGRGDTSTEDVRARELSTTIYYLDRFSYIDNTNGDYGRADGYTWNAVSYCKHTTESTDRKLIREGEGIVVRTEQEGRAELGLGSRV